MCFADCKKLWLYDVWNCCIADWFYIWEKHVCLQRFLFWLNCKFDVYSNVVEIKDCLNLIFSDFIKMYLFKTFKCSIRFYTKRLTNEFVSLVVFGFNIWTPPSNCCVASGGGCWRQEVINNGHAQDKFFVFVSYQFQTILYLISPTI